MKNERKIPSDNSCLDFAAFIAKDFTPKNTENDAGIKEYKFTKYQLIKMIQFCKGMPVQNSLWKEDSDIINE
jgi:hypothetical protein